MTSTTPYVSPSLRGTATLPDPEGYETLPSAADEDRYTKMTMDDIMNGNADLGFTGLVPLIRGYVNGRSDIDGATRESVFRYVDYVADKAAGRLLTTATWIRDFVAKHPDYKKDSTVSQKVNYDLMCLVKKIGEEDEAALESLEPYIGQYWKSSRGHVGTNGKLRENGDVVGKRPGDLSNCESC
jgi:glutamate--cysteine ligase catalytic subunit